MADRPDKSGELVQQAEPVVTKTLEQQRLEAGGCIKNHVIAAMGVGLIPSYVVEAIGVAGIEVKMIRDLAAVYAFPVPHKLVAYKVLLSLIGTIAPFYLAAQLRSAVKGMPVLGHSTYVAFLSVSNGAAVYAVGKVFQMHYESGGTFLSGDNKVIRSFFKEKFKEGKEVVPGFATQAVPA